MTRIAIDHDDEHIIGRDVCAILGISAMTLFRWLRREPGFPVPAVIGRRRYWRRGDILRWLEQRRRDTERDLAARRQA